MRARHVSNGKVGHVSQQRVRGDGPSVRSIRRHPEGARSPRQRRLFSSRGGRRAALRVPPRAACVVPSRRRRRLRLRLCLRLRPGRLGRLLLRRPRREGAAPLALQQRAVRLTWPRLTCACARLADPRRPTARGLPTGASRGPVERTCRAVGPATACDVLNKQCEVTVRSAVAALQCEGGSGSRSGARQCERGVCTQNLC